MISIATFSSLFVSVCFLYISFIVRGHKGISQTAGGDILLLVVLFDLAVLIDNEIIKHHLDEELVNNLGEVFGVLFALSLLTWAVSLSKIEKEIQISYDIKTNSYDGSFPFFRWIIGWGIVAGLFVIHYQTLLYKGAPV